MNKITKQAFFSLIITIIIMVPIWFVTSKVLGINNG